MRLDKQLFNIIGIVGKLLPDLYIPIFFVAFDLELFSKLSYLRQLITSNVLASRRL